MFRWARDKFKRLHRRPDRAAEDRVQVVPPTMGNPGARQGSGQGGPARSGMLTLIMLRCPDMVPPETRTVAGGEFAIGRGAENDWVLPDPERHLSKRYCLLAYRSGGWQVADFSTNGTFLNREAQPIGHGQPRDLRDGDRLRFGAYEIESRIAEAATPLHVAAALGTAAAPLFQLLAWARNPLTETDAGKLREHAMRGMRKFEHRVRDLGLPFEQLLAAHFASPRERASLDHVTTTGMLGSGQTTPQDYRE